MIAWREGRVVDVRREWPGAVELDVDLLGERRRHTVRALAYPRLVGRPEVGDLVLLNVAELLSRGQGADGVALVVALPHRIPADDPTGRGHLVKARHTPLQVMVLGVDEPRSEHHDLLADADDLLDLPVVVVDLHAALPAVLAGLRAERPQARVAYVMTDGGALPAANSATLAGLRAAGWLGSCISAGQAFGGDLEAVSVHTALLAARHVVHAEVAVVAPGPGNPGTGSRWGFSGVAAGETVNAAGVLHGRPIAGLRVSGADLRSRHRGISHHSLTAYGRVALVPADVPVPLLPGELGELVREQAAALGATDGRHRLVEVATADLVDALSACPVELSIAGRSLSEDPAAFLAPAAAGRHAATLLT